MTRHLTRRPPKKQGGFSWGRFPLGDTGIVSYRLFRRDYRGVVHMETRLCSAKSVAATAQSLRVARRLLRERVDEIDLRAMFAEEAA